MLTLTSFFKRRLKSPLFSKGLKGRVRNKKGLSTLFILRMHRHVLCHYFLVYHL